MPTSNQINANSAGVVSYDGAGNFSGSVITNHDVLVGGTSNSITSVSPSTAGKALVSNGVSADPSFQTVAGVGSTVTQHDVLVGGSSNSIVSVSPSTAGFVLTSNGVSADPSFQALPASSAFTSINIQTFTSSGTYTPTAGMKYCIVEAQGAGGGGGGAALTNSSQYSNGGGGGGGGYAREFFSAASIGASQSVTIGAGGTGGSNSGGNGGNGGSTLFGSLLTAAGGTGGNGAVAAVGGSYQNGGIGGGYLGTTIGREGDAGGVGMTFATFNTICGSGGGTVFGASRSATIATVGANGQAGLVYGGGGSGAQNYLSQGTGKTGGAGADGIVVVTEFI